MSILNNFSDTVEVYNLLGADFDGNERLQKASQAVGHMQQLEANESKAFGADGSERMFRIFFTESTGITCDQWVKVTSVRNVVTYLRIQADEEEQSRPSRNLCIWNVVGKELKASKWLTEV